MIYVLIVISCLKGYGSACFITSQEFFDPQTCRSVMLAVDDWAKTNNTSQRDRPLTMCVPKGKPQ